MIRVLIVDDQAVIRAGVARVLSGPDGFEVVGECADGDEVPAAMAGLQPDLVLMDIRMQRTDGIIATSALRADSTGPAVLVLTTFDDDAVLWSELVAPRTVQTPGPPSDVPHRAADRRRARRVWGYVPVQVQGAAAQRGQPAA